MPKTYQPTLKGNILHGDSNLLVEKIQDASIDLVITSPPYNIGKVYEKNDFENFQEYVKSYETLISRIGNKIKDSGSVCWQTGNFVKNGDIFPLDYFFYQIFIQNGFKLKNRIVWHYKFGLHASKKFSGRYETILWFTKSDEYKFNLDAVRVPQIYPGKRHSNGKGIKAGKPSGNRLGKNPSDFWEFSPPEAFEDDPIWNLPNVKANHPEKTPHPCQFPNELVERCVLALTNEGDSVFDPFVGVGTSVIAAVRLKRKALGIDRDKEYAKIAKARLGHLKAGRLKLRPSGKPIREPQSGEKVATVPDEWDSKR